jgi:hypothetical protein
VRRGEAAQAELGDRGLVVPGGGELGPESGDQEQGEHGKLAQQLPPLLKRLGLRFAPGLCMAELMTREELARVGMKPMVGHRVLRALVTVVLWTAQKGMDILPFSTLLARQILSGMIDVDRDGVVTFEIPFTLAGLRSAEVE